MNRRSFVTSAATATVLTAVGVAGGASGLLTHEADTSSESVAGIDPLETVPVRRGDLSTEREFQADVSFGEQWALNTAAAGTITQQHPVGTTIEFGETLLRLDDKPLFLASGVMPMYRELLKVDTRARDGNGDRLRWLTGDDVGQLQTFLLEAGFDVDDHLEIDGQFGGYTEAAVKGWQLAAGLPVTGRVDNTQIVFAPDPVRIATELRVGDPFAGLDVNNAEPAILVDTSNRDRGALEPNAVVDIELLDRTHLGGTVAGQEQVATADGSQVWQTTIAVDTELPGDASSATVTVTEVLAKAVLLVPTGALLALAEGGFAVEVAFGQSTELVRVDVGEVLDGQAEVNGDLAVGDLIVVPL